LLDECYIFSGMSSKTMTAQNSPSFERSEILIPILDGLEANDQTLFSRNIAPLILTRLASQGMSFSSRPWTWYFRVSETRSPSVATTFFRQCDTFLKTRTWRILKILRREMALAQTRAGLSDGGIGMW
jgi:hypothetical protein